jgi:hypothetical protein
MPRQRVDVGLDSSNKAEAACQVKASSKPTSVPMLVMFLPRLPFSYEQPFCRGVSNFFIANEKWDRKKLLAKINFCCTGVYARYWKHFLNGRSEQ